MTKKDYKIAVFGGIITIISSGIYDFIKDKPVLSSINSIFIWIWTYLTEFEIKIWQLILVLLISAIVYKLLNTNKKETAKKFTDYRRDTIKGTEWRWNWEHNFFENKWEPKNIIPICEKCNTRMNYESNHGNSLSAICPRCDNRQTNLKKTEIIEALIIDNVCQNLHP